MTKTLSVYITACVMLLLLVLGLHYVYPELELHLLLNSCHTGFLDLFFKYYSQLAEWPLYVLALLPLLWKKKSMTIFFALCELSAGAIIQLLKHFVDTARPASVFENHQDLVMPVVEGVNLHHCSSFPSGHASTFFIFFTCCAIVLAYHYQLKADRHNRKTWVVFNMLLLLLLLLAALGAYSRIYLSQHFLLDVWVGSCIGVITPFVLFHFCKNKILKLKNDEIK